MSFLCVLFILGFTFVDYALDNLSIICAMIYNHIISTFFVSWYSFVIKVF